MKTLSSNTEDRETIQEILFCIIFVGRVKQSCCKNDFYSRKEMAFSKNILFPFYREIINHCKTSSGGQLLFGITQILFFADPIFNVTLHW